MKKKIGVITTNESHPWGGSEVLWVAVCKILCKRGYIVGVNILKWDNTPRLDLPPKNWTVYK